MPDGRTAGLANRPGAPKPDTADPGTLLLSRPGVLVRRLHQVHSAMFHEECASFGVTPVQYSLLTLVAGTPGIEQGMAAAGLRLDRFTTADVVKRLQVAQLLRAGRGADRRAKALFLTTAGTQLLAAMQPAAGRAHDRLLEPLPARQRALLMRMLRDLVDRHATVAAPPPKVR